MRHPRAGADVYSYFPHWRFCRIPRHQRRWDEENQLAVKVTDTYAWTDEFTFTATEAGTYTFALPAGIGFVDADAYDAALETEATDDAPTPFFDYNEDSNGGNFSVDLAAGESIRFYVSATVKGTYIIGYSYAESV